MIIKKIVVVSMVACSFVTVLPAHAQQNINTTDVIKTQSIKGHAKTLMSEAEFLNKRTALIIKHSHHDTTFAALQKARATEDGLSGKFWHWKIDQYLYCL